jgi:hypothetical protein
MVVTLNTIKWINLDPSQQPKHLDKKYDWEEGFFDGDKKNYMKYS